MMGGTEDIWQMPRLGVSNWEVQLQLDYCRRDEWWSEILQVKNEQVRLRFAPCPNGSYRQ